MKVTDILPGTKVELKILQDVRRLENGEDIEVTVYHSNVFDILDSNTIELYVPYEGGRLITIPLEVQYEVIFLMEGSIFKAEGLLVERFKQDNFYLMKMRFESILLSKFQRREHYRLECNMPLIYSSLEDEVADIATMAEVKKMLRSAVGTMRVRGYGTILDISGGGIRFSSKANLSECKYMMFSFNIINDGESVKVEVIGKIIRSTYMEDAAIYSNSVKFFFKDTKFQDQIIRYIFEEERRIRQKNQGM